MSNKSLHAALKTVKQYGQQLHQEASADYKVALSASGAGQKNLMRQTRALTREALGTYAKTNQRLASLGDRATQFRSQEKRAEGNAQNAYGSALSGSIQEAFSQARTAQAGTARTSRANVQAGLAGAQTAASAMKIAQQGVKAGGASAKYALAQALQQRNIADNSQLGQMMAQLYETELQAQASFETWKKQQKYTQRQAEKTALAGLDGVASDLTPAAYDAYQKYVINNPDTSLEDATNDIAGQYAIAPGTDEYAFLTKAISTMRTQGTTPGGALYSIFQNAYGSANGWDDVAPALKDQLSAGQQAREDYWISHQYDSDYASYFGNPEPDSGAPGFWDYEHQGWTAVGQGIDRIESWFHPNY